MNVILYSDDLALITFWQKSIKQKTVLIDTPEELVEIQSSLIILNVSSCNNLCLELIKELKKNLNKVLMLHRTPDLLSAKKFLRSGADGYGNALMQAHFLKSAIYTIEDNMIWLHPELTSQMIIELPANEMTNTAQLSSLTKREKEVAMLLKDGDTYKSIAEKLEITPRTVKAHSSHIYVKLNVKDRLALALLLR